MPRVDRLALGMALALTLAGCTNDKKTLAGPSADAPPPKTPQALCDACLPDTCDAAAAQACYDLGVAYETGAGAPQDLSRAKAMWDRAAKAGHAAARDKVRARWGGI